MSQYILSIESSSPSHPYFVSCNDSLMGYETIMQTNVSYHYGSRGEGLGSVKLVLSSH